jgi:excinuclease UvrABC nuclease subunit
VRWRLWVPRETGDAGRALLASLGAVEVVPMLPGMYAYGLVGRDGKVFYVGRTTDMHRRIYEHVKTYGDALVSVLAVRVASDWSMTVTEDFLIDRLQPPMNVHGMSDEAEKVRDRMARRRLRVQHAQLAAAEQKAVAGD